MIRRFARLALLLSALPLSLFAQPKLHPLFSDHAVLQRDRPIPIWGTAEAEAEVVVAFRSQRVTAKADASGQWRAELAAEPASEGNEMSVRSPSGQVTLQNVAVGEVWVASGQSNMEWTVARSDDPDTEIAAANHPRIRLFHVPRTAAEQPAETVNASWKVCSPETVGSFSAVAYSFGRALQAEIDVPIGLIGTSWGGTTAEVWTPEATLAANTELAGVIPAFARRQAARQADLASLPARLEEWERQRAAAIAAGQPEPTRPANPEDIARRRPGGLWNGMIAPLIPYGFRGVIWYQGESNASRADNYRILFPAMIEAWRSAWGQGDFPFYFVQLANFSRPGTETWPHLREAQAATLSLPNTAMAVTIDIGNPNDIHPRNKRDVGKRLAGLALNRDYQLPRADRGPVFASWQPNGDGSAKVTFSHGGAGMELRPSNLTGFELAGEDKVFHPASAKLEGDSVIVTAPAVKRPVAVRYAFIDNPPVSLFNRQGLPAEPFRTDDW
jgi:sialate O-acetylesterase